MILAQQKRRRTVRELMQTGLRLPPDLWKRIKLTAVERDLPTHEIVIEGMESYFKRAKSSSKKQETAA